MASSSTANDDNDYDDLLDLLVQTWGAPPPDPRLEAIAHMCAKIKREDRSRSPADHADHTVVDESAVPDESTVVDESTVSNVAYELNRIAKYECIITDHFLDGTASEMALQCTSSGHEVEDILLQHCLQKIELITDICCESKFYVGICCSPYARWFGQIDDLGEHSYQGHCRSWLNMLLLCSSTGKVIASIEKKSIKEIKVTSKAPWCTNKGKGGERSGPKNEHSFFIYALNRFLRSRQQAWGVWPAWHDVWPGLLAVSDHLS